MAAAMRQRRQAMTGLRPGGRTGSSAGLWTCSGLLLALLALLVLPTSMARAPGDDGPCRLLVAARSRGAEPLIDGRAAGITGVAETEHRPFAAWLADFRREAARCGITEATLAGALDGLEQEPKIARLDRRQAEYSSTFSGYLSNRISDGLVSRGQARLGRWRTLLAGLEARYVVPPEVTVALWGLESAFGQVTGDTPTLRALATLAYDGRRRDFYQRELLAALRLIEAGHHRAEGLRGSWAGAMGQPQFMPTTFQAHAVDGDGDGRYDIWGSVPDVLTSTANYLAALHWRPGRPWGREVRLPRGFDAYQARLPLRRGDADWAAQGVRAADGGPLTDGGWAGAIVLPAGRDGPAFLVYDNFRVITEWNRSIFYGLTVGILSDRLAGRPGLVGRAPPGEQRLRRREVLALQGSLNRLGYAAGTPDGMIGMRTRQALRDFQRDRGLVADAYPSTATLVALGTRPAPANQSGLTAADIRALQQGLNARGYGAGAEDGLWGGQTRRALENWCRDQDLPPATEPTPALILRIATDE
jgi:membrane-bound lytic murein transglycosylase B